MFGKATRQTPQAEEETVISEILFKTLSLVTDLNLLLNNFTAARLAVKDLEVLKRQDSNTYLMKLRVLFCQLGSTGQDPQPPRPGNLGTKTEGRGMVNQRSLMQEIHEALGQL